MDKGPWHGLHSMGLQKGQRLLNDWACMLETRPSSQWITEGKRPKSQVIKRASEQVHERERKTPSEWSDPPVWSVLQPAGCLLHHCDWESICVFWILTFKTTWHCSGPCDPWALECPLHAGLSSIAQCCGFSGCVSLPRFLRWTLGGSCDGVRSWGLRAVLWSPEGGALLNEISALYRECSKEKPHHFCHVRTQWGGCSQEEIPTGTQPCWPHDPGCPASTTMGNKHLLFISHPVYGIWYIYIIYTYYIYSSQNISKTPRIKVVAI